MGSDRGSLQSAIVLTVFGIYIPCPLKQVSFLWRDNFQGFRVHSPWNCVVKMLFVLIQPDSQVGERTISIFLSRWAGSSKERLKKSACLHWDVCRAWPVHSANGWDFDRPEPHTGKSPQLKLAVKLNTIASPKCVPITQNHGSHQEPCQQSLNDTHLKMDYVPCREFYDYAGFWLNKLHYNKFFWASFL